MFQAHEIAMQLIVAVRPIVEAVLPHDRHLAEQLRRAATSAAASTAERGRRITRDRLHAFRLASAEAAETLSHARIAVAWGFAPEPLLEPVRVCQDRLQAMLWRLLHPRR
jgi:four helix bundle protein